MKQAKNLPKMPNLPLGVASYEALRVVKLWQRRSA